MIDVLKRNELSGVVDAKKVLTLPGINPRLICEDIDIFDIEASTININNIINIAENKSKIIKTDDVLLWIISDEVLEPYLEFYDFLRAGFYDLVNSREPGDRDGIVYNENTNPFHRFNLLKSKGSVSFTAKNIFKILGFADYYGLERQALIDFATVFSSSIKKCLYSDLLDGFKNKGSQQIDLQSDITSKILDLVIYPLTEGNNTDFEKGMGLTCSTESA